MQDDSLADSQHAVIEFVESTNEYVLKDLKSKRGTYLNGLRLDEAWLVAEVPEHVKTWYLDFIRLIRNSVSYNILAVILM